MLMQLHNQQVLYYYTHILCMKIVKRLLRNKYTVRTKGVWGNPILIYDKFVVIDFCWKLRCGGGGAKAPRRKMVSVSS